MRPAVTVLACLALLAPRPAGAFEPPQDRPRPPARQEGAKAAASEEPKPRTLILGSSPGAALTTDGSGPQFYAARAATGSTEPGKGDLNAFVIPHDTMSMPGAAANSFVNYLAVVGQMQGGTRGGRQGLSALLQQNAPSAKDNQNRNYVGGTFGTYSVGGDGGTAPSAAGGKGAYFGLNPWVVLGASATNILNVSGAEVNLAARQGSSVWYKSGIQIAKYGDDRVRGTVWDAAVSVSDQNGAGAPWKDGLLFSKANGTFPMDANGYLIRSVGGPAEISISTAGIIKSEAYANGGSIRPVEAGLDGTLRAPPNLPPASASAPCTAGQTAFDANYLYRCVAANTWKRAALSSW